MPHATAPLSSMLCGYRMIELIIYTVLFCLLLLLLVAGYLKAYIKISSIESRKTRYSLLLVLITTFLSVVVVILASLKNIAFNATEHYLVNIFSYFIAAILILVTMKFASGKLYKEEVSSTSMFR